MATIKGNISITNAQKKDFVFYNCPFDKKYLPIMHSIIFAVYRCGLTPKMAMSERNAMTIRLDKLADMIADCEYGIHDISRTSLDRGSKLPRFNMPFELGIFYGLKYYNRTKKINGLVLESTQHQYHLYISDLSGVDVYAHNDNFNTAIEKVRDWFNTDKSLKGNNIPSAKVLQKEYASFRKDFLPALAKMKQFSISKIGFIDYCESVESYLRLLGQYL